MQADIPDWEKSEKDRRMILREEKVKKERKKDKEDIRKVEGKSLRSNGEDWVGKDRHTRKNYSRDIVG